jgi:hypothetical protein
MISDQSPPQEWKGVAGGEHFALLMTSFSFFPRTRRREYSISRSPECITSAPSAPERPRVLHPLIPALTTSTGFDLGHNTAVRDADAGHPDPIPRAGASMAPNTQRFHVSLTIVRLTSTVETMDKQIDFPFNVQDIDPARRARGVISLGAG